MSKDAYYFPHDSNARHDPKILALRSVYGSEGYGWYWIIVEMLREQTDYRIKINKYVWNALAMQMQCTADAAKEFAYACIEEFGLLHSDGENFWSISLLKRMKNYDEKSEKARKAAQARWNKSSDDVGLMQPQSERNANAMQPQSERNASKVNKSKVKESKKNKYSDYVSMTTEEYEKLKEQFGEQGTLERIDKLNLYKGSTGKKYKDDYLTILSWERRNEKTTSQKTVDWEDL
jgi:hypothetical protein